MEYNKKSNTFVIESQNLRSKRKWDKTINEEIITKNFSNVFNTSIPKQ